MNFAIKKQITAVIMVAILMGAFMTTSVNAQTPVQTQAQVQTQDLSALIALIEQLRARLAELQAMRASQTSTGAGTQATSRSGADAVIGDEVTSTANLRVRGFYSPTAVIIATVPAGTVGTVINAASDENGLRWLQVEYETGAKGWSASPWLRVTGTASDDNDDEGGSDEDSSDNGSSDDGSQAAAPASCEEFYFEPARIAQGDKTTLYWQTENAERAVVTVKSGDETLEALANEDFPLNGSYEYIGTYTAEVTMTVYGESNRDQCTATVTVLDEIDKPIYSSTEEEIMANNDFPNPVSCEFTITPNEVRRGDTVTMEWSTENAARIVHTVEGMFGGESYEIPALLNEDFPLNGTYDFQANASSKTKLNVYGENPLNLAVCEASVTVTRR